MSEKNLYSEPSSDGSSSKGNQGVVLGEILQKTMILGYLPKDQIANVAKEISRIEHDPNLRKKAIEIVCGLIPESEHWDFLMLTLED